MSETRPLEGKVALVTGGVRGIGRAIVEALASKGATVLLTSRELYLAEDAAAEVAAKFGVTASGYECNVCQPESIERLFDAIGSQFPTLDILINNSGIAGPTAKLDQLPLSKWNEVIATNLTGPFLVTQAALPRMAKHSTIVCILSVAAKQAFAGMGAYAASKHGALGFARTLREDLRPQGIRVIAVLPGATDTEIWQQFWPQAPRAKMMKPEDIAAIVLSAILLPAGASADEITINPASGSL